MTHRYTLKQLIKVAQKPNTLIDWDPIRAIPVSSKCRQNYRFCDFSLSTNTLASDTVD